MQKDTLRSIYSNVGNALQVIINQIQENNLINNENTKNSYNCLKFDLNTLQNKCSNFYEKANSDKDLISQHVNEIHKEINSNYNNYTSYVNEELSRNKFDSKKIEESLHERIREINKSKEERAKNYFYDMNTKSTEHYKELIGAIENLKKEVKT